MKWFHYVIYISIKSQENLVISDISDTNGKINPGTILAFL